MSEMKSEELTESERVWLNCPGSQTWPNITRKALRIIDAHAADRAALVAQLEAANDLLWEMRACIPQDRRPNSLFRRSGAHFAAHPPQTPTHAALVAQLEDLKEERDALTRAHAALVALLEAAGHNHAALAAQLEAAGHNHAALVAQLEAANGMLARAQAGRVKRPREACSDQVQLDYDIGQHLQRHGWQWDAINRQWRRPASEYVETATWTEYRGREQ